MARFDVCLKKTGAKYEISFRNSSTLEYYDGKGVCNSATTYTYAASTECSGGAHFDLVVAPKSKQIEVHLNEAPTIVFTDACSDHSYIEMNMSARMGGHEYATDGAKPTIRNNGSARGFLDGPWCAGGWGVAALLLIVLGILLLRRKASIG